MTITIEPRPSGPGSVQAVLSWIKAKESRASDISPLWERLLPELNQATRYEFSDANPNVWASISKTWETWKLEHGYPATIGVCTGALKAAATDKAIVSKGKTALSVAVNPDVNNELGEDVGSYMHDYASVRPIYGYTRKWFARIIKSAVRRWIMEAKD